MRTVALLGFIATLGVLAQGPLTAGQVAALGAISGRLLDAVTGLPIVGATVELWPADERPMPRRGTPSITDDAGRYEFRAVAAGQYQVESGDTERRYLAGSWGVSTPFDYCCRKLLLKAGERVSDVDIRLWPAGALAGRAADEHGEPLVNVVVRYLKREFMDGRLTWAAGVLARTDDRGRFASGPALRPGEYLVVLPATQPEAKVQSPRFETVYYGGARIASQAAIIRLGVGERRDDIDLQATVTPGGRMLRVEGRVTANGRPLPGATVELVPRDSDEALAHLDGIRTQSTAQGQFSFDQVSEGDYRLRAWQFPSFKTNIEVARIGPAVTRETTRPDGSGGRNRVEYPQPLPDDPTWIADRDLSLTKSVLDVELTMQIAPRLTGQVRVAGTTKPPPPEALARMRMDVLTTQGRDLGLIPAGGFERDGRFHTAGLPAGQYLLRPLAMPAREGLDASATLRGPYYSMVSLHVDGREQSGEAVTIGASHVDVLVTVSSQWWEVSGVVRDANGRAIPGGAVVLFPQDRARWQRVAFGDGQLRRARADHLGAFHTTGVVPGDYFIVAVPSSVEFWMAPEYLETLVPLATAVPIGLGEKRSVELRLR